ncbi:MAG TPA: hypothetical protein VMV17_02495 [Streptosporangiaceae bacterium]|nr:hypothetical protein [Streptosporangiaceae bacterium]
MVSLPEGLVPAEVPSPAATVSRGRLRDIAARLKVSHQTVKRDLETVAFREAVRMDYCAHPVPRDATGD